MYDGQCTMDNGQWTMDNGQRTTDNVYSGTRNTDTGMWLHYIVRGTWYVVFSNSICNFLTNKYFYYERNKQCP